MEGNSEVAVSCLFRQMPINTNLCLYKFKKYFEYSHSLAFKFLALKQKEALLNVIFKRDGTVSVST